MSQPLVPCPSCARHIRVTEERCPFCKSALSQASLEAAVVPGTTQRLTRAAAFAFTASLAVSGCSNDPTGSGSPAPLYGAPVVIDGGGGGTTNDSGGIQPLYGAATMDAGPGDAGSGEDAASDGSPLDAGGD